MWSTALRLNWVPARTEISTGSCRWLRLAPRHMGSSSPPSARRCAKGSLSYVDQAAEPVIKAVYRKGTAEPDCTARLYTRSPSKGNSPVVVEYEPDTDLRDTEQIPLSPKRAASKPSCAVRCCPTPPDAWYAPDSVKVGYEISFTRHFYKPKPLRPLEEIRADMMKLERETEGLLAEIIGSPGSIVPEATHHHL